MFYLLEDNTIIDTLEISKNIGKISVEKDDKGQKNLYVNYCTANYLGFKNLGVIKKQSENVFDLVEAGIDLIKHKRNINPLYVELVIGGFDNFFKTLETTAYYVHLDDVLAIYKPNANGDYIKVWERKEE